MQKRFDNILAGLVPNGGRVLLAISGGVDSMALLHLFQNTICNIKFEVAHCNFDLRGEDSRGDEAFVISYCSENNIKCHTICFDTKSYSAYNGISIEMAARELRYSWFYELANKYCFSYIVVAHHANDNAETLILNLSRGTGLKGMCGIAVSSYMYGYENIKIIRPLLSFSRKDILSYVKSYGLSFRQDVSNFEDVYKRNKIRNRVMPILEEINPNIVNTFSSNIENFRLAYSALVKLVQPYIDSCLSKEEDCCFLDLSKLGTLDLDVAGYVIYSVLSHYNFNQQVINDIFKSVRKSVYFCDNGYRGCSKTWLSLEVDSVQYQAVVSKNQLVIRENVAALDSDIVIKEDGEYFFNGRKFLFKTIAYTADMSLKLPEGKLLWDADKLSYPLRLRCWHNGDWFIPLGMKGRKKLSDFFTDKSLSILEKEKSVILDFSVANYGDSNDVWEYVYNHIAGVLCLRIDDSLKVTDFTKQLIIVEEIK